MKCGEPLASFKKPKLVQIALAGGREGWNACSRSAKHASIGCVGFRDRWRVSCCDCMIVLLLLILR